MAIAVVVIATLALSGTAQAGTIRQIQEAPGQVVYQLRTTLETATGQRWQAIAFQRQTPTGTRPLMLRLVGFPGSVTLIHGEPLAITDNFGHRWQAPDSAARIFTPGDAPEPHIGQYRLDAVLEDLPPAIPLVLSVPTETGAIALPVSPGTVADWRQLAATVDAPVAPDVPTAD
jgi:hypothetical protein